MWLERKGLNGQRRKTMIVKLIIELNVFDILCPSKCFSPPSPRHKLDMKISRDLHLTAGQSDNNKGIQIY